MRKTTQTHMPAQHISPPAGQYDIYPGMPIGQNKIFRGFESLAQTLNSHKLILIDGYGGVFWEDFRERLDSAFAKINIFAHFISVEDALLAPDEVSAMITPFLGGNDPLFGTRFTGNLRSFFDSNKLNLLEPETTADMTIVYGSGATLLEWDAYTVYIDIPKNEIQFRARAGSVTNLGAKLPEPPKKMYKRFYFVDWIALNQHKASLLPQIDLIIDAQRPADISFMTGDDLRASLDMLSHNYFRVRPWFESGVWGGQWIRQNIPQLPQDVPNYAWSFELIVPENGLILESDDLLLEVSFDFLMYHDAQAILGQSAERFGYEFPIRFDFLDTFDGGNLSLQCHPRPEFITHNFGEIFTQDETYYILDAESDAKVYLGFQDDISPQGFRQALETSAATGTPVDVEQFVQIIPAQKHDLFLIPNGTIHCAGLNNLVLEISATPYIFTFKMYDWLRLDLNGQPRPLNIERAFENLRFEMQGAAVQQDLIAKPYLSETGNGWRRFHLPTHPLHFYDVYRHEIDAVSNVAVNTNDSCQILSLVEGSTIVLETANGMRRRFNYAETFVVPAGANQFCLINDTNTLAKVINAFVKDGE